MRGFESLPMFIFLILGPLWASATEFSCGKLFYRTLFLDEESGILYVGAMDRIIKIENLNNITNTNCDKDSMVSLIQNLFLIISLNEPKCIRSGSGTSKEIF